VCDIVFNMSDIQDALKKKRSVSVRRSPSPTRDSHTVNYSPVVTRVRSQSVALPTGTPSVLRSQKVSSTEDQLAASSSRGEERRRTRPDRSASSASPLSASDAAAVTLAIATDGVRAAKVRPTERKRSSAAGEDKPRRVQSSVQRAVTIGRTARDNDIVDTDDLNAALAGTSGVS
jgi:hypothetical protein